MYNSNYEEYMQNVLGYSLRPKNTYQMPDSMYEMSQVDNYEDIDLESFYPDIYRMIYPMVQKVCMKTTSIINEETIDSMTNEVYLAMEGEETRQGKLSTNTSNGARIAGTANTNKLEETRQQNFQLRDLIKILIIRELLRRRRRPGIGRPPMRPRYIEKFYNI